MTEKIYLADCPKFSVILKAHTQKKRLSEARHELLNIYPYAVEEKNILIVKTNKKNHYDVYISKEEIKYKKSLRKILLISLSIVFIVLTSIYVFHTLAVRKMNEVIQQKEFEKQKLEEARILKEKTETLEKLKKEYLEKKETEYEKIYPFIERIYSVMTDKTTIENLSIDNNNFSIEVTTKDSLKILSNFEQNKAFSPVKMNRTNIKDGKEIVTYTGEFSRFIKIADEDLTLEEKITFYSDEIKKINELKNKLSNIQLSQYIKNIRNMLHENNCQEQYIQLRGKEETAEVEFYILSTSKSILNFLNEIQSEKDNITYIKKLSIHNSEYRNRIQTTICFDTGIELKEDNEQFFEYVDKKIELSDLDKIFYKNASPKAVIQNTPTNSNISSDKKTQIKTNAKLKTLKYIGLTKSNNQTYVLAKDEEMGSIYKLFMTATETDGDFCVQTDFGFRAKFRGELYEVKK